MLKDVRTIIIDDYKRNWSSFDMLNYDILDYLFGFVFNL